MSGQSCSSLFALVDAAASLRPIPAEPAARAHEAVSAVISEDEAVTSDHVASSSSSPVFTPSTSPSALSVLSSSSFVDPTPRKKAAPLPVVLMEVLECQNKYQDVLSFLPDGRSFVVLRPHAFANGIMPRLFRCVKLPTFVKKLEKWGFRQVQPLPTRGGEGSLVFAHPLFRRGDWDNARKIRCVNKGKKTPSPSSSPPANLEVRAYRTHNSPFSHKTAEQLLQQQMDLRRAHLSQAPVAAGPVPSPAAEARLRDMIARQRVRQTALRRQQEQMRCEAAFARAAAKTAARARQQRSDPSPPSPSGDAASLSQAEVDQATRTIMGAAMDVLARDKNMIGSGGGGASSSNNCAVVRAPSSPRAERPVANTFFLERTTAPLLHRSSPRSPPLLAREMPTSMMRPGATMPSISSHEAIVAAMMSEERLSILRMEAELAATRKAEVEAQLLLAARHRRAALLASASIGAR